MEKFVYNLVFPDYVEELKIGDYLFKKVNNYDEVLKNLQHSKEIFKGNRMIKVRFENPQITAIVKMPNIEKPAVLDWEDKNTKQISDIELLLTLLTNRNVFLEEVDSDDDVEFDEMSIHTTKNSSALGSFTNRNQKHDDIFRNFFQDYDKYYSVDFKKGLNRILETIQTKEWQEQYSNGHFLFLYNQSIQEQPTETSFILCWTIWEHIFTLNNKNCLDEKTITSISGHEKIAFILNKYFLMHLDNKEAKEIITKLTRARNRIIHYGKKNNETTYNEILLFISITGHLVAIILGLIPSKTFNSTRMLELLWEEHRK